MNQHELPPQSDGGPSRSPTENQSHESYNSNFCKSSSESTSLDDIPDLVDRGDSSDESSFNSSYSSSGVSGADSEWDAYLEWRKDHNSVGDEIVISNLCEFFQTPTKSRSSDPSLSGSVESNSLPCDDDSSIDNVCDRSEGSSLNITPNTKPKPKYKQTKLNVEGRPPKIINPIKKCPTKYLKQTKLFQSSDEESDDPDSSSSNSSQSSFNPIKEQPQYFSILLQNANSLYARYKDTSWDLLIQKSIDWKLSALMIPETCVNWDNQFLRSRLLNCISTRWGKAKSVTSHCGLCNDLNKHSREFLPGGTLTSIMGKWVNRIAGSGMDNKGRWSWIEIRGKKEKNIMLITAYKVNKKAEGDLRFYTQLQYKHLQEGLADVDPWKQ